MAQALTRYRQSVVPKQGKSCCSRAHRDQTGKRVAAWSPDPGEGRTEAKVLAATVALDWREEKDQEQVEEEGFAAVQVTERAALPSSTRRPLRTRAAPRSALPCTLRLTRSIVAPSSFRSCAAARRMSRL